MSLRFQGLAFSALAWLALVACLVLPSADLTLQLMVLSPVILLLGVPHGALDIVFMQQLTRIRSAADWGLFTLVYLAVAALVVVLWWFAPHFFLVAFLLGSVLHFSGDPESGTPASIRLLYGGAFLFCPLALHAPELGQVFAFLAGAPAAQAIVQALQWAAWPWIAAIGVVALAGARRAPARSVELVSITALLTFTPPLIGFAVFFCAMHSARHMLRTCSYANVKSFQHLLRIAAWPMLVTVVGVVIAWWLSDGTPLDMRLAQLLFVGMAALTVPHMLVVERVRFTGWQSAHATPQESTFRE